MIRFWAFLVSASVWAALLTNWGLPAKPGLICALILGLVVAFIDWAFFVSVEILLSIMGR